MSKIFVTVEEVISRYLWNETSQPANINDEKYIRANNAIGETIKIGVSGTVYKTTSYLIHCPRNWSSLAPHLSNYLAHADARLDNNVAERGIRPLTIGRKNWLFVGSEDGGKASATIPSLVQTCRNLGINPQEYLEDVLRRIMSHPARQIHQLLPDNWLAARKSAA